MVLDSNQVFGSALTNCFLKKLQKEVFVKMENLQSPLLMLDADLLLVSFSNSAVMLGRLESWV